MLSIPYRLRADTLIRPYIGWALLDNLFLSTVHIDASCRWLACQSHTVQRVPGIVVHGSRSVGFAIRLHRL